MTNIQFIQITPEQLVTLLTEGFQHQIQELTKTLSLTNENELLTREKACELLTIDNSTLWRWTNKGRIKAYGIAGRRYYKKAELLEALTPIQVRNFNLKNAA